MGSTLLFGEWLEREGRDFLREGATEKGVTPATCAAVGEGAKLAVDWLTHHPPS